MEETGHYNSVLEIGRAVSFLGIHKSETGIHFEFSPALNLQYTVHVLPIHVINKKRRKVPNSNKIKVKKR
jgi:hypothetical protein